MTPSKLGLLGTVLLGHNRYAHITTLRCDAVNPRLLEMNKVVIGRQEGAMVGYNPHKPGRPSHCYHTFMMANLRLVLGVDVQPGDEHTPKHGQAGLWSLLQRLGRSRWPALLRGDVAWGVEPVM